MEIGKGIESFPGIWAIARQMREWNQGMINNP